MGVPPSPATQALLDQGLNVVGRVCKTSKNKFFDLNAKHIAETTKLPDSEFKKLSRAAQFFREGHFTTEDIKKIQAEAKLAKEAEKKAKEATKLVQESTKLVKESKKILDKTKKLAEGSKKVIDTILSKVPGADTALKALNASNMLGVLAIIGVQAGLSAFAAWVSNFVQDSQEKTDNLISEDLTKLNGRTLANTALIRKQQQQIVTINQKIATTTDKIYAEAAGAAKNATVAREKANDALYEVRAGRTKLEAEIAEAKKKSNDALYETRAGRTKLEEKIASVQAQITKFNQGVTSNFQSKIEVTIGIIQGRLNSTEAKVANLEKAKPTLQDKVIQTVQDSVKKVSSDLGSAVVRLAQLEKLPAQVQTLQSQVKTIEVEHPKRWGVTVTQAEVRLAKITVSTDSATRDYVERKFAKVTESQFSATEWVGRYGAKTADLVDRGAPALQRQDEVLAGGISATAAELKEEIRKIERGQVISINGDVGDLTKKVADLRTQLDQVKANDAGILIDISKLDTKVKEQEKVNQAAIPKLDQILGILPAIPGRTAAAIAPSIATIPQIEQAAATGTCRTLQPGGCGAKALDNLGNNVNQNTNQVSNNLLDKLNAGANAAQLALLKIMDNKLGKQITGGISGKLVDGFKWLHLDRVLGVLTFAATVQNHIMLSNNIGTTLLGAFGNVLSLIGLKDDKGEAYDIGSVINSSIENLVKGIVGTENYATISEAWAKANRIYQATANVLNAFQNISSTVLSGLELVAGQTGKIGNALRKSGEVLESAYGWMNPQPKINRITQTLEGLNQGASTIQQITQAPIDVIEAVTGLQTANTELVKAWKEDDKPANKGVETPEPEALKTKEALGKGLSAGKVLAEIDKEADEDGAT